MAVALTVAGSDSGGGAGIQADLKTFEAFRVYGASVVTAITAQNTLGVSAVHTLPAGIVAAQMESVLSDFDVAAAKTGMLATADIVEVVATGLRQWKVENLVIDPVMIAKSGDRLLQPDAVNALIRHLLPLALVITPNIPEAEVLAGTEIRNELDREAAARRIREMGPRWVILKGGHLAGEPVDLVWDGVEMQRLGGARIDTTSTHGTGCTFAAAITASLSTGATVDEAVAAAKQYVTGAIMHAEGLGHGHGPLNHHYAARQIVGPAHEH